MHLSGPQSVQLYGFLNLFLQSSKNTTVVYNTSILISFQGEKLSGNQLNPGGIQAYEHQPACQFHKGITYPQTQ